MIRWSLGCVAFALALGNPAKGPAPLPPLNQKVFEFARDHLGRPVGDGICVTLAIEALREADARPPSLRDRKGNYEWGEPVLDFKDVLPGDILQFRDAVFHGQRSIGQGRTARWHQEYPHHTAIVARVEQAGHLIVIYHQNVKRKGKAEAEKANVQEGELRMDSLQKGGWVKAYRPSPPEPKPATPDDR